VRVVAHRPEWRELFKQERRALVERLGHLAPEVEHVGSTAVPALDAKPIIDIAGAVRSTKVVPRLRRPLDGLGYIYGGDAGADGSHIFVKESAPEIRTHHLHVVAIDDPQWREYLLFRFRERLRTDELLRTRYAELKKALLQGYAQDRKGYTSGKKAFIEDLK
jgi:GrpB-like predicted nucleotidyltransferase (UPF0157 family)